jgi:hypothetical protein
MSDYDLYLAKEIKATQNISENFQEKTKFTQSIIPLLNTKIAQIRISDAYVLKRIFGLGSPARDHRIC